MPDAHGNFRGTGWSRKSEDAYDRIFGRPEITAVQRRCIDSDGIARCQPGWPCGCKDVPHEPSPEVDLFWEEADRQAARDGYNPEW